MARKTRAVVATLAVRVPVNATGSLADGAVRVVDRIDTVERVEEPDVRGLQPALNDTVVEIRLRITIAVGDRGEDLAVVRRDLADAVGVRDVESVEAVDPDAVATAGVG